MAILFIYFFNFVLSFTFFMLICRIWVEHAHFFLLTYLGGTLSPLLDISEQNFFSRWGDAHAPTPVYAPGMG